jgi:replication factor C subunit 2/4
MRVTREVSFGIIGFMTLIDIDDGLGIDVVRNRIKGFAQKKVTLPQGRHKLVILDEADRFVSARVSLLVIGLTYHRSMTAGAQQALRRTMEIYSSTTRFAFACNQSNKIIEPLQSRCAILRYARLTDAQVVKRLMQICEAEKVQHSEDGIAALVFSAEGDMRQAINNLQSTWSGFGFVSGDNVFRVVDSPHPVKVQAMIKACWEGKVDVALEGLNELWYVTNLFDSTAGGPNHFVSTGRWVILRMISSVPCSESPRPFPHCLNIPSWSLSGRLDSRICVS